MKYNLIRFIMLSILCLSTDYIFAKDEYRAEVGVLGGVSFYLGDANLFMFNNLQSDFGGFFRYKFDTRIALKAEFNSTKIAQNSFENSIRTFDLCGEYNFFDLEKDENKRLSKIFSPYIFVGAGMMNYDYNNNIQFKPSYIFGLGMKLMLSNQLNLNFSWSNKLLLSDTMEGLSTLNNPNSLNGSNIFNNDFLSTLTVGLSFNIWRKECKCMNINPILRK